MIVSCPSCQRNYVVADEQIAGKQFRARCKSCGIEFRLDGMTSQGASSPPAKDEPAKFMSATEAFLAMRTAPPSSAGSWSVCLSKTDTRRMTTDEVAQAHAKGTVGTSVFVWKSGMPKWLRLSDVPELMAALGKPLSKAPNPAGAGGAGVGDAEAATKSEPSARTGSSIAPARGSRPTRPLRSATLMGTGSLPPPSVSSSSSVPPRSGQTFPPPALELEEAPPMMAPPPVPSSLAPPPVPASEAPPPVPASVAPSAAAKSDGDARPAEKQGLAAKEGTAAQAGTADAPGASASATAGAARAGVDAGESRRSTPVPQQREIDIPVDVDVPATGGIVLPPLKGEEAQAAAAGSIAAASSLLPSPAKPESVSKFEPRTSRKPEPNTAPKADSRDSGRSDLSAASARVSSAASSARPATSDPDRDSYPPFKPRGNRYAGVFVAMAAVGIVGVLGGVAGAVYVMKASGVIGAPAVSVAALQPQPATPVSVGLPGTRMASALADVPTAQPQVVAPPAAQTRGVMGSSGDAAEVAARGSEKSSASSGASRPASNSGAVHATATPTPKSGAKTSTAKAATAEAVPPVGFSAPPAAAPPAAPAAATPPPAAEGGATPFNRERALAVLGFAASRAPTCKKPDGPHGTARVHVTFDPSGMVVIANVAGAPIAGTPVAQCVSGIFRKVKIAPFSGERVTVSREFTIPP